jgi:MYXO-CTERM domain-containing protein
MNIRVLAAVALSAVVALIGGRALAQTCPQGYPNYCGNDLCCPSGYSCGGNCGYECCGGCPAGYPIDCNNGKCCPSGAHCTASGCAYDGSGSGSYSSGSYSSQDSALAVCDSTADFEGCDLLQACANGNGQAWYDADGRIFDCTQYGCEEAAREATDYCESKQGCSVAAPGAPAKESWALGLPVAVAAMAFAARRRRRAAKAAALVLGGAACASVGTGCVAASGTDTSISVEEHQREAADALRKVADHRGIELAPAVETPRAEAVPAKALGSKGARAQ